MEVYLQPKFFVHKSINMKDIDLKIARETKWEMAILLDLLSKLLDLAVQTLVYLALIWTPNSNVLPLKHQILGVFFANFSLQVFRFGK